MNPLAATWLCWAIIGLSPIAGKYAVGIISPALLVFLGTLIGVIYFAPWVTKNKQWGALLAQETRWKFLFQRHLSYDSGQAGKSQCAEVIKNDRRH